VAWLLVRLSVCLSVWLQTNKQTNKQANNAPAPLEHPHLLVSARKQKDATHPKKIDLAEKTKRGNDEPSFLPPRERRRAARSRPHYAKQQPSSQLPG